MRNSASLPSIVEIGRRRRRTIPIRIELIETHDAIGVRVRKGAEKDAVHDAEHRRRRTHAERQSRKRCRGESRIATKAARADHDVAPRVLEPREPERVARGVFGVFDASECLPRRPPSIGRIHSCRHVLRGGSIYMEGHFFGEARFHATPGNEAREPSQKRHHADVTCSTRLMARDMRFH
jgi:hypothetical protein